MLKYPEISPTIFEIGPFSLRWYGLMYAISFYILVTVMRKQALKRFLPLSERMVERLFMYLVFGILIGARIFYILFYSPEIITREPGEILAIWHGGLSFHGGFFGVFVASLLIARQAKVPWASIADTLALCGPVGFGLGRIGNFINGELFGRVTNVPWAMVFPAGGPFARHPSQLYESLLEGLVSGLILWLVVKPRARRYGVISASAMLCYAVARFTVEFFREPDVQLGFILGPFTMGQLLTLGVFIPGFLLLIYSLKYGAKIPTQA